MGVRMLVGVRDGAPAAAQQVQPDDEDQDAGDDLQGRGEDAGVCLLVTEMPAATAARERLDAVAGTTDGFELARLDLELRREGDVLGAIQSGRRSGLRLLSLLKHEDVIVKAQIYAHELVAEDPGLAHSPGLASLVGEVVDADRVEYLDKS